MGFTAEQEGAGKDLTPGARIGRAKVARDGGEAVGPALGQEPAVRRRAEPFLAEATPGRQADGGDDIAAGQSVDD
jgi:hypothetical protein